VSGARAAVLARVRAALVDGPPIPDPVEVPAPEPLDSEALLSRFVERVRDYRAAVARTDDAGVPAVIDAVLACHGAARLAVAAGFPAAWRPRAARLVEQPAGATPDARALDAVDGVLSTCLLAIAETGTIVLDAGPGQGPRALTLVPDLHVCVVRAGQVVPGVPQAVARMAAAIREHGRPLTMVSGPSATSDIELDRVEGVHGPRRLEVVVAEPQPPPAG